MAEFPRPPSAAIGNCIMADYRAYLLGSDGHFFDAVPMVCETDNEAIEKAKHLVGGHDVEYGRWTERWPSSNITSETISQPAT
jgi:hypothetical protein